MGVAGSFRKCRSPTKGNWVLEAPGRRGDPNAARPGQEGLSGPGPAHSPWLLGARRDRVQKGLLCPHPSPSPYHWPGPSGFARFHRAPPRGRSTAARCPRIGGRRLVRNADRGTNPIEAGPSRPIGAAMDYGSPGVRPRLARPRVSEATRAAHQRGDRPARRFSRRFLSPRGGDPAREPLLAACFMATHSRAESTPSNHSRRPSRSTPTTEPRQIF